VHIGLGFGGVVVIFIFLGKLYAKHKDSKKMIRTVPHGIFLFISVYQSIIYKLLPPHRNMRRQSFLYRWREGKV
jgi:prepilin signal peptidase PulO-like enzyme (type II secretory pathway)